MISTWIIELLTLLTNETNWNNITIGSLIIDTKGLIMIISTIFIGHMLVEIYKYWKKKLVKK